jgi:hypothetical protein
MELQPQHPAFRLYLTHKAKLPIFRLQKSEFLSTQPTMRPPSGGDPYPIPLNQAQWQETVNRIRSDRQIPCPITVAYDDLCVAI